MKKRTILGIIVTTICLIGMLSCRNADGDYIYTVRVVSVKPDFWTKYCRYTIEPLGERDTLPKHNILAECRWQAGDTIVVKM